MAITNLSTLTLSQIIANFHNAAGPLVGTLLLLILTVAADTITGMFAAWKSGTLSWKYADTFLTSHVQDKWGPILGALFGGVALGGIDTLAGGALVAFATAQVIAYEGQVFGNSIPQNMTDAAAKTKGAPGSSALIAGTIESIGWPVDGVPDLGYDPEAAPPSGATADPVPVPPAPTTGLPTAVPIVAAVTNVSTPAPVVDQPVVAPTVD